LPLPHPSTIGETAEPGKNAAPWTIWKTVLSPSAVPQFLRYGVASGVALGADLVVFIALAKHGMHASFAGAIGYTIGTVVHYGITSRFVFSLESARKAEMRIFVEFVMSGLVGLAITASTIALMTDLANAAPLTAKGVAVVLSFVGVFLLRRSVVFAPSKAPGWGAERLDRHATRTVRPGSSATDA
jgi:putative flippase GtrA